MDGTRRGAAIKEEIFDDVRRKAERLTGKARRDAEDILAKASEQADAAAAAILAAAERRAVVEEAKIAAGTGLEIRKLRLIEHRKVYDEAVAEALSRLRALAGPAAEVILKGFAQEGAAALGETELAVSLAPAVPEGPVADVLGAAGIRFTIRRDPALAPAETVLATPDGTIRYEGIFATRFAADQDRWLRLLQSVLQAETTREDA